MATLPAPRRVPLVAPAPRRPRQPRPSLRVVREANRHPRYALWTVIGVGGVFAVFFALVMFHTLLLQNQRRLDELDSQVRSEQATYQQLRLQVAQLQSPERVLDVATTKLGLVPSSGTTYLTPSGADAVAARQAQAEEAADDGTTSLAGDNQGASSGWPQIKPYLSEGRDVARLRALASLAVPPSAARRSPPGDQRRRIIVVLVFVVLLFALVAGRLAQLQLLDGHRFVQFGESQRVKPVTLPAERGSLFDREGNDLALSVPQHTVWADPRLVTNPQAAAAALAPVLGIDQNTLLRQLTMPDKHFVYLSRQVDDTTAQKVRDLKLDGIDLLEESKRFNPSGQLAQGVLGSVNVDNVGRAGLEQQYESTLTGTPGQLVLEQDPRGGTIAGGEHRLTPAQPGNDLILTIDTAMQFETERALSDQIVKMGAKGGIAVVSNPKTGEILAMADIDRPDPKGPPVPSPNNRALTTVFEPGSAAKVITMSAALEEAVVPIDTRLSVPDHLQVADAMFTDHDPHPTEQMSLTDILANSSNIGTIMLGQKVGKDRIDSYMRKFGFGSRTSLDFPNESAGIMLPLQSWSGTSIATIPMGQGIAVTALQMLQAYNVIANGGVYVDPKLVLATVGKDGVRHDTAPSGSRRVISAQSAAEVRDMMEQVVASGTGKQAAIDGYTVAGKTGTARKPQPNGGYTDGAGNYHYEATFAGFVPAEDPELSTIVVLDEPTATIFASGATAPTFSRIAAYGLRRFEIPPPGITLPSSVPAPTHASSGLTQANEVTGGRPPATTTPAPKTTTPSGG